MRSRVVVFLGALALVLAACGGSGGDVVATVNGQPVTVAEVEAITGEGAVPAEQFANGIMAVIVEKVVTAAAEEEFGITATPEDIDARYAEIREQVEAQGVTWEEFLSQRDLTEDEVRAIVAQIVVQEKLAEELGSVEGAITEEEIESAYDEALMTTATACIRHILVETEEEADEVKQRLEGGEDFETVAKEVSIEPNVAETGGDLGCGPVSNYVPPFALAAVKAEIGEVTGPVQSNFGYHVLVVESREAPTLEEAREGIVAQLESGLVADWIIEELRQADVTVEEQYGEWVTEPVPDVKPPAEGE